ncbi:MAG: HAD family hydrolase [Desulfobacterota bacterium]|nr:HAD family hydrolase [Thermodesulfobacteriota bacterium]
MRCAVFLDRDGTLNIEKGYIRNVADVELIPGAARAVRALNDAGILCIITSNQTGAARGYYPISHIHALNHRVVELLMQEAGARIDAVYFCPHYEGGIVPELSCSCVCRKPAPGMIHQAIRDFPDIDLKKSFVVGDKATDIAFARNAGCKGILVTTGYGQDVLSGRYQTLDVAPDAVCSDITAASTYILRTAVR